MCPYLYWCVRDSRQCVCVCVCVCACMYSKVMSEAYDFRGKASYGEKQKEKKGTSGQRLGPLKSRLEVV